MGEVTFKAGWIERADAPMMWRTLGVGELPPGDVLVRVTHSAINYKDALAVTARGRIARKVPLVPGIDLAGEVVESGVPEFAAGERVFAAGGGIGESMWGGYAGMARLPAPMLMHAPEGWSGADLMVFGTAGFTAMLAVFALEDSGLCAGDGPVLVTGAGGALGGTATALLAARGHEVVASTGRMELEPHLRQLGARRLIARGELDRDARPLEREQWAGVVDVVGGRTLATAIAGAKRGAAVAACGLAGGAALATTVYPFILKGVKLLGIDSFGCPAWRRDAAWARLLAEFPRERLHDFHEVIPMEAIPGRSVDVVEGRVRGRVVVAIQSQAG